MLLGGIFLIYWEVALLAYVNEWPIEECVFWLPELIRRWLRY